MMFSRRDFLKKTGQVAALAGATALGLESILLSGCVTAPPTAGRNPYFKGPGSEWHSFMGSVYDGWSPGVDWLHIGPRTPIVATAKGKIQRYDKIRMPGHTEGYYVDLEHESDVSAPLSGVRDSVYRSVYAHVDRIQVDIGQQVKRGDVIGYGGTDSPMGTKSGIFKLMLREHGNHVNPNNYGQNHSFMQYWDGSTDLEIEDMGYRLNKQNYLMEELLEHYVGRDKDSLLFKKHSSGYYGTCYWSTVEKFWYLEKTYSEKPQFFPGLTDKEVSAIRSKFYENQPIVLTLPFKKPG